MGWSASGHRPSSPASKGPIVQASPGSPVLPFPVGSVFHECTPSHRPISHVHTPPHTHVCSVVWVQVCMQEQTWADTGVETEAAWHTVRLALASFPDACGLCMQIYMYARKMHTGVLSDTHVHVHTVCRCWRKYARTFLPSCPHTPSPQDKGRAGRKWTALPGHDSGLPFAHR